MPDELVDVFWQCLREEIGPQASKSVTLKELGERRGYLHKQAPASGGTQVFDMLAVARKMREKFCGLVAAEREKSRNAPKQEVHLYSRGANRKHPAAFPRFEE